MGRSTPVHSWVAGPSVWSSQATRPARMASSPRSPGDPTYLPCQTGGRFSAKARGPSLASSVEKISELMALSLR